MAVFLLNICKFNKCGMEFGTLVDLIQHIEENHIGKWCLRSEKVSTAQITTSLFMIGFQYGN
jgi:hypothetical protein